MECRGLKKITVGSRIPPRSRTMQAQSSLSVNNLPALPQDGSACNMHLCIAVESGSLYLFGCKLDIRRAYRWLREQRFQWVLSGSNPELSALVHPVV